MQLCQDVFASLTNWGSALKNFLPWEKIHVLLVFWSKSFLERAWWTAKWTWSYSGYLPLVEWWKSVMCINSSWISFSSNFSGWPATRNFLGWPCNQELFFSALNQQIHAIYSLFWEFWACIFFGVLIKKFFYKSPNCKGETLFWLCSLPFSKKLIVLKARICSQGEQIILFRTIPLTTAQKHFFKKMIALHFVLWMKIFSSCVEVLALGLRL